MKEEKTQEFLTKYPKLFKLQIGLECGEGWSELLHQTCSVIEHYIERMPEELQGDVYATQIKEKFGSLRCYMSHEPPYIQGVIALAENMSGKICEMCGNPGRSRSGGWIRTLCDFHFDERERQRAELNQKFQEETEKKKIAKLAQEALKPSSDDNE